MKEEGSQLLSAFKTFCTDVLFQNIPKILVALLVLWIGWKLVKWVKTLLQKVFARRNLDQSLQSFLCSIIDAVLKTLLIITVAGMIGIQMTSFIAILGAAGLAVGMALQGTLQNFAGGVIILTLRPFKVGDYIQQGDIEGSVKEIQIFNTVLLTPDCKTVVMPNTQLATNTLTNYTRSGKRRVDIAVGIAYGEDVGKARAALLQLAATTPKVLQGENMPTEVVAVNLGDSAVNLELRVWAASSDYWDVKFTLTQGVYETLGKNGIEIPFNQMTVHIDKE
ncbi:MAG: mechanosensitive ion channel family protein [Bacteroidales bacterium]|nr:mechanosensitive ion channel family protein [Bacteroidales bacterium]MCR5115816.1 mechanosensitive ion channel family protein [Bacteroidales bacterium]